MQFARKEMSKKSDKKQSLTLFQDQEYDNIDILNEIKSKDCKNDKKKNDKKSNNEKKTTENYISNIKFANIINLRSFKYANMFINKTFNNLL
jgi:hypothetical protein